MTKAKAFEAHRTHLRAVAYRMLGSVTEADDVVQEAYLRLARSDISEVENLRGWLTTVVARLCLDELRSRKARREDLSGFELPELVVDQAAATDPEEQAVLADSVGIAMLVVLDTLTPAERLAFVLHDVFAMPFDEIAPIVSRSPLATRQLASRARRRVRGARSESDVDLPAQREVVDAFLAAARDGDFERLLSILDPDVVARADFGSLRPELNLQAHGAAQVAQQALSFRNFAPGARPVTVNGAAGLFVYSNSAPFAVLAFTVRHGLITEIDIVGDPERIKRLSPEH